MNYLHLARDVQVVPRHSLSPREQVRHRAHHVPEHRRDVALLAAVPERLRLQKVLKPRGHRSEDGGGRLEVPSEEGSPAARQRGHGGRDGVLRLLLPDVPLELRHRVRLAVAHVGLQAGPLGARLRAAARLGLDARPAGEAGGAVRARHDGHLPRRRPVPVHAPPERRLAVVRHEAALCSCSANVSKGVPRNVGDEDFDVGNGSGSGRGSGPGRRVRVDRRQIWKRYERRELVSRWPLQQKNVNIVNLHWFRK